MTLHLVKKILMICIWCRAKDPKELEVQLNLFYVISLFLPELAWYIYGNIFIYNSSMEPCRYHEANEIKALWITVIILIVDSYIYFLVLGLVAIFFCCAYKLWLDWTKLEIGNEKTQIKQKFSEANKPV